ncbi:pyridine nucleotide-disulfide oxidoreductase-domain-containing protein [Catenaria anguillulae PL171]|uniref:NADH:ubiquinone reductase (non-electrogenic) n=1 Tax=Catenaria anguillulae PL171 TaxID=765915 RepID=A0A1Y2HKF7_9FUNG|nr:pyridine nucleotide-disulfide oxidoreductase-domain-containing protein [Catenaria anguillulae PL171]
MFTAARSARLVLSATSQRSALAAPRAWRPASLTRSFSDKSATAASDAVAGATAAPSPTPAGGDDNNKNKKKRGSGAWRKLKWTAVGLGTMGLVAGLVVYRTHPLEQQEPDPNKKTVVVLGTGWGAISFLRRLDTSEYQAIVVSPRNFFLFTPLLPSVTTGSLESRSIITPIKYFLRFKPFGAKFVEAEATDIDPKSKTVEIYDSGEIKGKVEKTRIPYDYLVVAVGAESQTFGIKGVREYGLFLKELWDAKKIRTRLMDCIETAAFPGQPEDEIKRLLHLVVVGGGPTGIEYAGELHDFIQDEVNKWYPEMTPKVQITLIEALPNVLPMFSRDMIEYTEKSFKDMKIDLLNNTAVKEVKERELVVADKEGNKRVLPYGMLVSRSKPNRRGIMVDDYLRVVGVKDIWALGDCTATKFAPTAQVASQEGAYLARQFNDMALTERTGKDILASCPPFTYKHRATLAYIGDERGVSDVEVPIIGKQMSFSGYQSYLFWRSAYLSNLFTLRNKTLVAFDWTKEKIFGRDISRE